MNILNQDKTILINYNNVCSIYIKSDGEKYSLIAMYSEVDGRDALNDCLCISDNRKFIQSIFEDLIFAINNQCKFFDMSNYQYE